MSSPAQPLTSANPLAPPVYNGLMTPDTIRDFTYPYDVTLTALQRLNDTVTTNMDADFQMTAIIVNNYTSIQFSFNININGVYFMSSSEMLAANVVSDPSVPFPILGKFVIPRGATINISISDLSNASNSIELLFRGVKLYGNNAR